MARSLVAETDQACDSKHPNGIAAVIIETIQGEGGDGHFRTEFFQQLRQICDESDIMLIFDEVSAEWASRARCGHGSITHR